MISTWCWTRRCKTKTDWSDRGCKTHWSCSTIKFRPVRLPSIVIIIVIGRWRDYPLPPLHVCGGTSYACAMSIFSVPPQFRWAFPQLSHNITLLNLILHSIFWCCQEFHLPDWRVSLLSPSETLSIASVCWFSWSHTRSQSHRYSWWLNLCANLLFKPFLLGLCLRLWSHFLSFLYMMIVKDHFQSNQSLLSCPPLLTMWACS